MIKTGLNVVALFDGIACGKVALDRIGHKVDSYYSSEINKNSIAVSNANHSDIINLGDVRSVRIPKNGLCDLILAGSPCQGFSFAGKGLNFEDPRSKLFFEFVRVLKEAKRYNPSVKFILENVVMLQEHQDVITDILEVQPIRINSDLVSAQMRKRIYWTNIEGVVQPADKKILLKDIIIEQEIDLENTYTGGGFKKYLQNKGIEKFYSHNNIEVIVTNEPTWLANERRVIKTRGIEEKSTCLTLSSTSIAGSGGVGLYINGVHRRISRLECERLQTLPDGYTNAVSGNIGIAQCGNGWTVDVICHILKNLN